MTEKKSKLYYEIWNESSNECKGPTWPVSRNK